MSKTSTVTLTVSVTGDGLSESYALPAVVNAAAPGGGPSNLALATGFNSIAVPPGSLGFILIPPVGSVITKTLKGITGDTGIPLHVTNPTWVSLPPATATIGITAGGAGETVAIHWL
jgi:hypothetical protein